MQGLPGNPGSPGTPGAQGAPGVTGFQGMPTCKTKTVSYYHDNIDYIKFALENSNNMCVHIII